MVEKMLRYLEASNPKIAGATREDAAPKRAVRATSSLLRLSILVGFASGEAQAPAPARSPRSFDAGAVGLGIVAAMSCGGGGGGGAVVTKPAAAAMARAEPIAIGRAAAAKRARTREEMELSESYTCVISHVGGNRVRKRVYFGDGYVGAFYDDDDVDDHHLAAAGATSGDCQAPPPPPPPPGDFLSKCYLCNRKLDGLDVYMYRGEKAFCSAECRCQQMLTDECWENCGSIAMKSYENSPCSAPMKLFSSGVAVA